MMAGTGKRKIDTSVGDDNANKHPKTASTPPVSVSALKDRNFLAALKKQNPDLDTMDNNAILGTFLAPHYYHFCMPVAQIYSTMSGL